MAILLFAMFIVLLTNVFVTSFEKLGVPRPLVGVVMGASLFGSFVNIPVWVRSMRVSQPGWRLAGTFVFYRPPQIEHQVLAVNVGGALVPVVLSLWLLHEAPLWKVAVATAGLALLTHRIARIVPDEGIAMPVFVPPLAAAAAGWLLARGGPGIDAAAIAYISGSVGTLIGADLSNLGRFSQVGAGVVSVGGAGVFDGVFLVGIVAALLT